MDGQKHHCGIYFLTRAPRSTSDKWPVVYGGRNQLCSFGALTSVWFPFRSSYPPPGDRDISKTKFPKLRTLPQHQQNLGLQP